MITRSFALWDISSPPLDEVAHLTRIHLGPMDFVTSIPRSIILPPSQDRGGEIPAKKVGTFKLNNHSKFKIVRGSSLIQPGFWLIHKILKLIRSGEESGSVRSSLPVTFPTSLSRWMHKFPRIITGLFASVLTRSPHRRNVGSVMST